MAISKHNTRKKTAQYHTTRRNPPTKPVGPQHRTAPHPHPTPNHPNPRHTQHHATPDCGPVHATVMHPRHSGAQAAAPCHRDSELHKCKRGAS